MAITSSFSVERDFKLTSIQNIRLRKQILLRFINGTWSSSIPTLLFGPGEKILGDEII